MGGHGDNFGNNDLFEGEPDLLNCLLQVSCRDFRLEMFWNDACSQLCCCCGLLGLFFSFLGFFLPLLFFFLPGLLRFFFLSCLLFGGGFLLLLG